MVSWDTKDKHEQPKGTLLGILGTKAIEKTEVYFDENETNVNISSTPVKKIFILIKSK